MQEYTEKLTKAQMPLYDTGGCDKVYFINEHKMIQQLDDPQHLIRLPLIDNLTDEDLNNFRAFLLETFPIPLYNMINMCIVEQDDKRGAFAGFGTPND